MYIEPFETLIFVVQFHVKRNWNATTIQYLFFEFRYVITNFSFCLFHRQSDSPRTRKAKGRNQDESKEEGSAEDLEPGQLTCPCEYDDEVGGMY